MSLHVHEYQCLFIHVWSAIASLTFLFFFLMVAKTTRTISIGCQPWTQATCGKEVFILSPIDIIVDVVNKSQSMSEQGFPRPTQGFSNHAHSCQSQWICGAVVNLTRSKTPRPPRSIGPPTVDQLILQLPLVKLSSRDHKKHFLHPSMDCRISLGALMIVRR